LFFILDQSRAFLRLLKFYNITTTAVLASNDEFGSGVVQAVQSLASSFNITISTVINYDVKGTSYVNEWQTLMANQIQTVFTVCSQNEALRVYASALSAGALDGSMWIIGK
jgi:DNA-binding LacI/PurR family transcriptional regulator